MLDLIVSCLDCFLQREFPKFFTFRARDEVWMRVWTLSSVGALHPSLAGMLRA